MRNHVEFRMDKREQILIRFAVSRALCALAFISALPACEADLVRSSERAESGMTSKPPESGSDVGAALGQSNPAVMIDPDPKAVSYAAIVAQKDVVISGRPACAFTIRYPNAVDQPLTWNDQPCSALTTGFVSFAKLVEMRKVQRLPAETLEDLKHENMTVVFYVENDVTASIYPLNVAGRIYEVTVAD